MKLFLPAPLLRRLMPLIACVSACLGAEEKAAPVVLPITDTAALKAHVGKSVSVSGKVSRVGMSKSGGLVFINFEGVQQGGFSSIVRSANLPDIEWAAGANLDVALPERRITVSGIVSLYKESPQIELKTADQLQVSP